MVKIIIEGRVASGKSELAKILEHYLKEIGFKVINKDQDGREPEVSIPYWRAMGQEVEISTRQEDECFLDLRRKIEIGD